MSTSQSLPLYQRHKQVRAVKIKEVLKHAHPDPKADDAAFESSPAFQGAHLLPIDERFLPIAVDADWYRKHSPKPGGYYVLYEDGYASYSPAAAFENSCSPVLAMAQQNSRIESAGAMVGASASISGQQRISHREELERVLVSGASAQIAHNPENAAAIAKGIKVVLDELAPVAPHPVAIAPLPVLDHGTAYIESEIQAKEYSARMEIAKHGLSDAAKRLNSAWGNEREIQARAIPAYQQRVLDEKRELDERLSKLDAFILDNPMFTKLLPDEQERLARQSKAMAVYSGILDERIACF